MGKHLDEKSLMVVNKKSIFHKIKAFFVKLFRRDTIHQNESQVEAIKTNEIQSNIKQKNDFIETIRNIENDETRLLKLQKQFDNGEIDRSQLSKEQILKLTELYKKQINDLKESNEKRINKIRQHKDGESFLKSIKNIEDEETKLLKLQQQYDNRLIEVKDIPKEKINALISLYKKQISELSNSNRKRKEKLLIYRNKMQNA